MSEPGRVAFEARFKNQPAVTWEMQSDEVREIWAGVERAVLTSAHRLPVIEDAWGATLSREPAVVALGEAAARVLDLVATRRRMPPINGALALMAPDDPSVPVLDCHGNPMPRAINPALMAPPPPSPAPPGPTYSAAPQPTAAQKASTARSFGFTGNACQSCGEFRMVRTGTCETCQDCQSTSGGCS